MDHTTDFTLAARSFVDLIGRIAPGQWEQPALGTWTVRGLVGHTSRAISTVANYLGDDPQRRVEELLARTTALIAAESPERIVAVGPLGIRLDQYLRTRVFELVVHSMDIGAATGLEHRMPASVVAGTAALAARTAVLKGAGTEVLFALTGRGRLPQGFSIL